MSEYKKEFEKTFQKACKSREKWSVWYDWVECCAIAINVRVDLAHAEEREAQYKDIISKYKKEEYDLFPEMLGLMAMELDENPDQDFLGSMYMELGMGDTKHGQFFTPYNVAQMLAALNFNEACLNAEIEERGYVSVAEPSAGAGGTMIAVRNALNKMGIGSDHAFFFGQELMRNAAMQCYLQLSLLGCAGYVCIGDTLVNPGRLDGLIPIEEEGRDFWMLPAMADPAWQGRIMLQNIRRMEEADRKRLEKAKEQHKARFKVQTQVQTHREDETGQMSLF